MAALPVILLPLFHAIYPEVTIPAQGEVRAISRRVLSALERATTFTPPGSRVALEWYLVPTLMAFGIATACYANLALRISLSREQGVLQRVRVSPVRPSAYLAGWVGSSVVVGVVVGMTTAVTGWLLYGVTPVPTRMLVMGLAVLLGSACFCALGLATAGLVPSPHSASACVLAVLLPLAVMSNVFYLPGQAPEWLAALSDLLPLEPFRSSLTNAYAKDPSSPPTLLTEFGTLGAWTVIGAGIAIRSFSWMPRAVRS